jgi:arabinose-5-phosphate isomerase
MSRGGMGMAAILDADDHVAGIYTDGDLRRSLERIGDVRNVRIDDVMTCRPRTIAAERLAVEAVEIMEQHRISQLLVADDGGRLIGALTMHDLMLAKVI